MQRLLVVFTAAAAASSGSSTKMTTSASIAARGEKRRVRERLARMIGEIDRAEDSLEESGVSHSRLL